MAQDDRQKLYDMIKKVRIAMMTTVHTDGSLHTRPMASQEADSGGNLWFFTQKDSAVAAEIQENGNISLGYSDPGAAITSPSAERRRSSTTNRRSTISGAKS